MRKFYTVTLSFVDKNELFQTETHRFGTYERAMEFFTHVTLNNYKFMNHKRYVRYTEISFKEVVEND